MINIRLNKKIISKRNQTVVTEKFEYVRRFSEKQSEGHDNFVLAT